MFSVWENALAFVSMLSWWERAFFGCWWEFMLLEVTGSGCCHFRAGWCSRWAKSWCSSQELFFPGQVKIYFETCFIIWVVQSVTALWVNRELSFLSLASVTLTSLPDIHLRFQAFPGSSGCCQCSFRIKWLIKHLLVLGAKIKSQLWLLVTHLLFWLNFILSVTGTSEYSGIPHVQMGEGSRISHCCLGNSCSWIL